MNTQDQGRQGPLTRIRVLDLGTMLAAPVAATLLADFGADVIKVEQPGPGDSLRGLGPFVEGECLWWQVEGRNKRSVSINLRRPEGQAILKRLVAEVDVLIENFRPGTMDSWNLGYEELRKVNPRLVMLSISGFGQTGPNAKRAAYDRIALAYSGVMGVTGFPDRPPIKVGNSVADYSTAMLGAFSVMMALYHRDVNGGQGQQIDLALYETVFRITDTMALSYDQLGMVRTRTGNVHHAAAPGNTFETKDGRYLIMTISGDVLFRKLGDAMGRPDLPVDPKFINHDARWQRIEEINGIVADWMASKTQAEVAVALTEHGIPFSPVLTIADIFEDEHYAARGNLQTVKHPKLGNIRMQGVVPRLSATPAGPIRPARGVGEDNAAVLGDLLGMSEGDIARMKTDGIL